MFWVLLTAAILSAGSLTTALAAPPSPLTGLSVAASGTFLAVSTMLASRIFMFLGRPRTVQDKASDKALAAGTGPTGPASYARPDCGEDPPGTDPGPEGVPPRTVPGTSGPVNGRS